MLLRRRLRPGGLSARGRAARRQAPAGRKLSPPRAHRLVWGAAGAPSPGRGWPPGLLARAAGPRPDSGGRRPGCPLAASSSETLFVAPGSLLVPRPPSPGARVLLPPLGARRAALRDSGAERSAAWRRLAGCVSRQLSPARRADRARRPAGSAGAARGQDPLCADQQANVPGARRLPQGLPPPPPSSMSPSASP